MKYCTPKCCCTVVANNANLIVYLDGLSIEEDAERKIGWLLKMIFAGTASLVAYQFFPYMGKLNTLRISYQLTIGFVFPLWF